jgi:hypothetical protein
MSNYNNVSNSRNGTELATGQERDLQGEAAKVYYKHLKEDIVSGFNGGDKFEVFLMVVYLPVRIICIIMDLARNILAPGHDCFPQEALWDVQ